MPCACLRTRLWGRVNESHFHVILGHARRYDKLWKILFLLISRCAVSGRDNVVTAAFPSQCAAFPDESAHRGRPLLRSMLRLDCLSRSWSWFSRAPGSRANAEPGIEYAPTLFSYLPSCYLFYLFFCFVFVFLRSYPIGPGVHRAWWARLIVLATGAFWIDDPFSVRSRNTSVRFIPFVNWIELKKSAAGYSPDVVWKQFTNQAHLASPPASRFKKISAILFFKWCKWIWPMIAQRDLARQ